MVGTNVLKLRCRDQVQHWLGLSWTVPDRLHETIYKVITVIAVFAVFAVAVVIISSVHSIAMFFLLNSELFLSHLWKVFSNVDGFIRLRRLLLRLLDFKYLRQFMLLLFLTFSKLCCSVCYSIISNEFDNNLIAVVKIFAMFPFFIFRNSQILPHVPVLPLDIFGDQSSFFLFFLLYEMKQDWTKGLQILEPSDLSYLPAWTCSTDYYFIYLYCSSSSLP